MKKKYSKPSINIRKIEAERHLLAGSGFDTLGNSNQDYNVDDDIDGDDLFN